MKSVEFRQLYITFRIIYRVDLFRCPYSKLKIRTAFQEPIMFPKRCFHFYFKHTKNDIKLCKNICVGGQSISQLVWYKGCTFLKININIKTTSKHFFINPTDAHNYKNTGMLKQLKFPQLLRHVSVHSGTITRELFRA